MENKRRIGENYTWMTLKRSLISTNRYIAETTLENSKPYLDLFDDIYYNHLNDLQDEFKLNIIDSSSLMNYYNNKELRDKEFPSQEVLIDKLTKLIKLGREQRKDQWIAIHPREIYEFFPRDNKLQPKQYWDIITEWIKRQTNTLENFKILCYCTQYTLDINHVKTIRTDHMSISMNDYEERNCILIDTEYFIKSRFLLS